MSYRDQTGGAEILFRWPTVDNFATATDKDVAVAKGAAVSKTIAQRANAVGFPKPRELIEIAGAHALEASDRALFNVMYEHAHGTGRLADPGAEWELPMAELRRAITTHNSNARLRDSLQRLLSVIVQVPYADEAGEERVLHTHLFDFFDLAAAEADGTKVRFGVPRKLAPIIAASGRWGRIRLEVACAMSSKYALALYELVRVRAEMHDSIETFAIDRFRDLMGVPPGTYERGNDFVRKVIEPALLEVNGLSEMAVQAQVVRRSGPRTPICAVTVVWSKKDPEEFRRAYRELNASKLGRRARLNGHVETALS